MARTANSIKKGDIIAPIHYGSDGKPTDQVEFASLDGLTVLSISMWSGALVAATALNTKVVKTFKELGMPRFSFTSHMWGLWRKRVCTVPIEVANDMMREYVNARRSADVVGPSGGNRLTTGSIMTNWDRDHQIAS